MDDELLKLYNGVSANLDVGSYEEFSKKMQSTEDRKSFYNAVANNGMDLGDYNEYESRLKKKDSSDSTSTAQELGGTSTQGEVQDPVSGTGEVEPNDKELGIDPPKWDSVGALLEQEREILYNQLKNSTPEDRSSMGFETVPETYEEFAEANPTSKEKIEDVKGMGLNVFEEKKAIDTIIAEESAATTQAKQDTYDIRANYASQKKAAVVNEAAMSKTPLTDEEKRAVQYDYERIQRGDLTFTEDVEAVALGAWNQLLSLPMVGVPPSGTLKPFEKVMPKPELDQMFRDKMEAKKINFMKSLIPEELEAYQTFQKHSPEGSVAQKKALGVDVREILKESDFMQDRLVSYINEPLMKGYIEASNTSQDLGKSYLDNLGDSEKKQFLKTHRKISELQAIHQNNLEQFNSMQDDILSYDIESELAHKNFGIGTNLALAYVNSWARIGGGVMDAINDPLIAMSKPDDMSYEEFRNKYLEGTWGDRLNKVVEESEPNLLGSKLNDNWWSLYRLGLLSAEQIPVLATIAGTGTAGLGILSTSVYGNKIREYSKDGDVSMNERFAAGLSAGAEYLSERVTLGIMKKAGRGFKAAVKDGKISDIFSKQFGKGVALGVTEEGNSEVLAQFGENYADIYIVGDKDKNIFTGFQEAWRSGAIMGGIMRSAPELAGSTIGQFFGDTAQLNKIKSTNIEIQKLLGEAMKPNMSDAMFGVIEKRVEKLSNSNQKRVEKYVKGVESLSSEDVGSLISLGNLTAEARKELATIRIDETISPDLKQVLENTKKVEIESLEEKKTEILDKPKESDDYKPSAPIVITEEVEVDNAPTGNIMNVGMREGQTDVRITQEEIESRLPDGVEVLNTRVKDEGKSEETLVIETSRPLTPKEMKEFLVKNKQQAIPQMVNGKGVLYGNDQKQIDDNWGGRFAPEYFATLNDDVLKTKEKITKTIGKEGTEVKTSTKKVNEGLNKPAKMIKVGDKVLAEPVEGDIFQEGQRVIFEDKDGNQSDLGNIDEIGDKGFNEIKEFGIATEDTKVTSKGNTITVEGVEFKKDKSVSIKKNAAGDVTSVTLTPIKGGKKVTFRGDVAADIQYTVELGGAIKAKPVIAKKTTTETKTKPTVAKKETTDKKKTPSANDVIFDKTIAKSKGVDANDKKAIVELADRVEDRVKRGIVRKAYRAAVALKSVFPNFKLKIHETQESFDADRVSLGNKSKTTAGFIAYSKNKDGSFTGQIHISLERANIGTVAHEVAHAVFLGKFDGDSKLYNNFKSRISKILGSDLNKDLQAFSERYDSEEASEEYLVQLIATISNTKEEISLNTMQKIAQAINEFVSKLTGGAIKPFKNTADTKELVDFINKIASDIAEGADIDLGTQGLVETSDGIIISNQISTSIKGKAIKNSVFVNNLELERFDTHRNTTVVRGFDLRSIVGQLASSTLSDKLVAGKLGKFKLFGGIGYPEVTGLLWAASNKTAANKLLDKLKRSKDGNYYLLPAIMSNVSHMSNKDMSVVAMEVMKEAALNNELDLGSFKDRTVEIFSNKGLVKYKDKYTDAIKGVKSIDKALDTLLDFMFTQKLTFEQRRGVLQSLIGESTANKPKFKTVGTFTQLAESLAEPLVKDSSIYEVVVAYRTGGDLSVVKLPKSDPRYHKSYPYAIESTAKVEVLHLKDAYNLVDIFPRFTKADGEMKSLAQELKDKKDKYTEKYIRTNLGRTHGLSSYSEPINVPQKVTVKNQIAPDTRTEEEIERSNILEKQYREQMEMRFTDDGNGNYVFRHHSNTERSELSPRTTHGNLVVSKEEQRAINAVGGLTMYYTEKGQAEQGVGNIVHEVHVPKDKVYVFQPDVNGYYDEAIKRFKKKYPNQSFDPNFQAAFISQVAAEQGYPMTVAKWRRGEFRGQTTETLYPETVIKNSKVVKESKVEEKDKKGKLVEEKTRSIDRVRRKLGQTFSDKLFNFKNLTKNLVGFDKFLEQDSVWQSKAAGRSKLVKDRLHDIINKAKSKGVSMEELSDWMMAKHATDRNMHIKENVDNDNPFGSGLDDVTISEILDVSEERAKTLDKLSEGVYKIIEENRKRMLESGLINQEAYDALAEVKSYVPLTNFEDESLEVALAMQGKGVTIRGSEFKKAGGRTTKAGNILVNVLQQSTSTEVRAAKNEFLNTIYDLVDKNKESGLGKIYTEKTKPEKRVIGTPLYIGVKVNGAQKYVRFFNDVLGENIQNTTDHQVGVLLANLSKLNNYFRAVITTYNPEFMLGNFPRDLETAIIHLQAQQDINPNIKGKKITMKTVKNIGLAIKVITKFELGKHQANTKWAKQYENFIKDGGKTGWTEQTPYEDVLKDMKKMYDKGTKTLISSKIKKFGHYIESVNSAVENGVRFSAYVAAVEAGVSRAAAASLAKELTVNFNRKGEAGTLLNAAYLFSNTAIQGTMTMYRNLSKVKVYEDLNGKKRYGLTGAQKLAGALVAFGGLLPLLNRAVGDEDEETGENYYDTIPDFIKERNIIIMTGGQNYISIPLPYGYNTFYNFGEMTSDVITKNRDVKDAAQFLWGAVLGSFSPVPMAKRDTALETLAASAMPTEPLRFVMEMQANKNYNNMNIFNVAPPYEIGEVPDATLGRKNTPNWANWTAGLLNEATGGSEFNSGLIDINPETIIYTIHRAGGGVSKLAERTFSLGEKVLFNTLSEEGTEVGKKIKEDYGVDDKKSIEPHTIPLVRRYFGKSQDVYFSSKYYDIRKAVVTDYNVKKAELEERGITELKELSQKERTEVRGIKEVNATIEKIDKKLKELRKEEKTFVKKFDNRRDLQAAINALDKEKIKLYKKLYKSYKDNYK